MHLNDILPLVVVLGVLIFVHEAGHFIAAKAMGIQVLRFSLGFGKPLLLVRRGETEYCISWLPLGGYVKMAGLEDEGIAGELEGGAAAVPVDPNRAFDRKPVWKRMVVILAGVTMNAIFAFVVYTGLAYTGALEPDRLATTAVDSVRVSVLPAEAAELGTIPRGSRIVAVNGDSVSTWGEVLERLVLAPNPIRVAIAGRSEPIVVPLAREDTAARMKLVRGLTVYLPPVLAQVQPGGPGDRAGFKPGDRILRVQGDTVASWQDFARFVREHAGDSLTIQVARGEEKLTLHAVPERRTETDPDTKQQRSFGLVGLGAERPLVKALGVLGAVQLGWRETVSKVGMILQVLRRPRVQELGGPLTIGQVSGQAARAGLPYFLGFMALLSVNLAVLNLLPIPILDGGQAVFLVAEAVRRRPLSVQLRSRLTQIGFVVLVGIMLLALRNDFVRQFLHVFSR
jgi:regulator of sigma E protease